MSYVYIYAGAKHNVGIDMDRVEILIDNLLIYMPADMPFLASLIARPDGVCFLWAGHSDRAFGGLAIVGTVANDIYWSRASVGD